MKTFIKEYLGVIIYTICGLLIVLSSYNIFININHYSFLQHKVTVRDIDANYKEYKENVLQIENNLFNSQKNNGMYNVLSITLKLMKEDGAYRLLPGDKLGYNELYTLNEYFINSLINDGWITNLKSVNTFNNTFNNEYMNVLISNANYVNKELQNNSNFHYDVKDNDIRNTIQEEYKYILGNYKNFSSFVLELSKKLGDNNG